MSFNDKSDRLYDSIRKLGIDKNIFPNSFIEEIRKKNEIKIKAMFLYMF
jgi:hypothetical protein